MQEKLLKLNSDKLDSLIENNTQVNKFKRQAKILQKQLREKSKNNSEINAISLRQCQDIVAQQNGYKHWHEFHTNIKNMYQNKNVAASIKYNNENITQYDMCLEQINIGYNPQLGMQAWLSKDALNNHIFLDNSLENKIEEKLIEVSVKNKDHIIYMGSNNEEIDYIKNLAVKEGREKDIRTISFVKDYQKTEQTNWYFPKNVPFNSNSLIRIMVSLLENKGTNHSNWRGQAVSLVSSIIMALVYLRDKGEIILDFKLIQDYLLFENFITLYNRNDLPINIKNALQAYLKNTPNYIENSMKQNESFLEYHGHIQMQITKVLSFIIYNISHLFQDNESKECSENVMEQLYGSKEKLIFLIKYPDFSKDKYNELSLISYLMVNMIMDGFINKLVVPIDNKEFMNIKATWFIKNCPLPKGFKFFAYQAIATGLQLRLSYKNFNDYCDINEKEAILDNCNIKFVNFKSIDNTIQYQLSFNEKEEILIL